MAAINSVTADQVECLRFVAFRYLDCSLTGVLLVQIKKVLGDRLGSLDQNDEDGESDHESGLLDEAQAELEHLDIDLGKLSL